jgi:ubiquinone biosynthesis protein
MPNIPSECRSANIVRDHAMILPDDATPKPDGIFGRDSLPGNRIALIDFGMVGRLSSTRRSQMVDLLAGFLRRDEEAMMEVLLDWRSNDAGNEARLAADLGELALDYSDAQLKDLRIGTLLHRVAALLREHSIVLPADLALLFKALITLEGFGRRYDPDCPQAWRFAPGLRAGVKGRAPWEILLSARRRSPHWRSRPWR